MSVTKHGVGTIPTTAPTFTKEFITGAGETRTEEYPWGDRAELDALYEQKKAEALAGSNIAGLTLTSDGSRGRLVVRIGREGGADPLYGDEVAIVEELYAIDIQKDIWNADYFNAGGTAPLSDNQVAWVRECCDQRWSEDEIDTYGAERSRETYTVDWSAGMKELRYHILHGEEVVLVYGLVLRRSLYGVRSSQIKTTFTGINTVVTTPTFRTEMQDLVDSLPSGEWLKRVPDVEHLGKGRWRVSESWQWAEKWSVVYGGTWKKP